MGIYKDFIIFIVGFFIIIKSADLFTSAAESIAIFFNIPRVIIGLTIVSMATTFPELTVSALSSYLGQSGIAIGNATGSCLANIGLILPAAAIIREVSFNPQVIKRELVFLLAASVLLFFLMWDGNLSSKEGVLLLTLFIAFYAYVIRREFGKARKGKNERAAGDKKYSLGKDVAKFGAGAIGVVACAKWAIIPAAVNIAHYFKVPEIVIGITMVAVGTSLPELVTAIIASVKKMGELALGNVIGANILNLLWVLGASSLIKPLAVDRQTRIVTMPLVIVFAVLVFIFTRTQARLSRNEGVALFCLYAGYIFYIVKFAYI